MAESEDVLVGSVGHVLKRAFVALYPPPPAPPVAPSRARSRAASTASNHGAADVHAVPSVHEEEKSEPVAVPDPRSAPELERVRA